MDIALVTGASSGLGEEFVRVLAEQGKVDEIWAIARRKERLAKLAAGMRSRLHTAHHARPDRQEVLRSAPVASRAGACNYPHHHKQCRMLRLRPLRGDARSGDREHDRPRCDGHDPPRQDCPSLHGQGQLCRAGRICILLCAGCGPGRLQCCQSLRQVPWAGTAHRAEEAGHQCACALAWQYGHRDEYWGGEGKKAGSLPYLNVSKIARNSLDLASRGCSFYTPGWFFKGYRIEVDP